MTGGENFMQVGQPLHGIGEGLLVDLAVLRPDPFANGAVEKTIGYRLPCGLRLLQCFLRLPASNSSTRTAAAGPSPQALPTKKVKVDSKPGR